MTAPNTPPTTRAEAAAAVEQLVDAEYKIADYTATTGSLPIAVEHVATLDAVETAPEFLSLATRRVLYILGLAALVIAPTIAVDFPAYADAIQTAGNLLATAALGTALANPARR